MTWCRTASMSTIERGRGAVEGAVDSRGRSDASAITAATIPVPPTLRGRDPELATIGESLGRLRAGSGSVILIEAPSGMGKSRLIDESVRLASRLSLAVGGSAAEPGEGAAELAPMLRALFGG